jgi:quercetin dioxygenase-like cupin family protein
LDVFNINDVPSGLRLSPLRTGKVAFFVYDFQPWQAISACSHPDNDAVFYVAGGECLFYVGSEAGRVCAGSAVSVTAGSPHAVLACEGGAALISVQGPLPIVSVYGKLNEYSCPACRLDTPLVTGTMAGDIRECPRCLAVLRLVEAGSEFVAAVREGQAELQRQGVNVSEWDRASKGKKLPARAPKKRRR